MPQNRSRDSLQPALLDRLLDDARTMTVFEVNATASELEPAGVEIETIVHALTELGLRPVGEGRGPEESNGQIELRFAGAGRTVALTAVKNLPVRCRREVRTITLSAVCDVRARTEPNTLFETPGRRAITTRRLRACVLRDLQWLFNATSLDSSVDLDRLPHVARSVVNYGMPSLAGVARASLEPDKVAERIRSIIGTFEPRLSKVRVTSEAHRTDEDAFGLSFRIEAELWGQPVSEAVLLRTRIDLTSGDVSVSDGAA